jgi:hypothetical protein
MRRKRAPVVGGTIDLRIIADNWEEPRRWKNTAREGVARFALVEAGIGSPTQSGIADPAESEQGTLQAADFPERLGERVLSGILGPGVYAAHTLAHL